MAIQTGETIPESDFSDDVGRRADSRQFHRTFPRQESRAVRRSRRIHADLLDSSPARLRDLLQDFFDAGVDTVACMSVNDGYVMDAWSRQAGADGILMLADGNAEFTRALGLELDATGFFMGMRSQRFALVADDGVVSRLFVEKPAEFKVSSAEHVLANL